MSKPNSDEDVRRTYIHTYVLHDDTIQRTNKEVIQQLTKEKLNDDRLCNINSDFYSKLREDDRILAYEIARIRLKKLRDSDFDCDDIEKLTTEELTLSRKIVAEIKKFFDYIANVKPINETPIEIQIKEMTQTERVGTFSTFTNDPCRHCADENHFKCTSATLVKALPSFQGESWCACYRLNKSKHSDVKEFTPKGLFRKTDYDDSSSGEPIGVSVVDD